MGQEPAPMTNTTSTDPDLEARRAAAQREAAAVRSDDPGEIRRDIAETRADMEGTLEAINDRVNPQRVYERRSGRARQRWTSLKQSVMGSDDRAPGASPSLSDRTPDVDDRAPGASPSLSDRTPDVDVRGRAQQATQAVGDAPDAARRRTRGNPLAAGMITFGIGALIGGALPETDAERQAVGEADRHLDLQGTKQRLTERAQQVGDDVKASAQDAAQDLKGSAQGAAQDVKGDATREGERVRQDAQEAKDRVQRDA
jgi:Protein of unknown function (DUF3618)